MGIFKIFIPKEKAQTVTEIESWTVTWWFKSGWGDGEKERNKVFISLEDANKFEEQLKESAKFIGCYINTSLKRN